LTNKRCASTTPRITVSISLEEITCSDVLIFNNSPLCLELGWFSDAVEEVVVGVHYTGPLKGTVNYLPSGGPDQDPVIIKVGDYFIGFNHK
jgi:hypothetical protein